MRMNGRIAMKKMMKLLSLVAIISLNVMVFLSNSRVVTVGDFFAPLIICYFALCVFYPNLDFKI